MVDDTDIYDVAIAGGGLVGLAAALTLAAAGYRVAVIERQPAQRVRGSLGYDIRSVALTAASKDLLCELADLEREDLAPIKAMHVWEHDGAGALRFTPPDGIDNLAWVAENSAVVTCLCQAAESRVTFFVPASVTALAATSDFVTLAFRDGENGTEGALRARLAIAADGADSRLRSLAGARVRREPAPKSGAQMAVATVARTRRPHRNIAWQRFGATGPVALLPLADERSVSIIWSVAESVGLQLRNLTDENFKATLTNETEQVCGGFEAIDRRFFFPLQQTLATDFNPMQRVILAGDAARTLHPLAGQGVNIGLEDVRAIATALGTDTDASASASASASARKEKTTDPGACNRWRSYADNRRRRSKLMLGLMRGLLTAYCGARAGNPWMRLARNTAVRCIDSSPAVKAQLVREAFGLGPLASQ